MIMEKVNDIIVVRGGGDIASGAIQKLYRSGFKVIVLETEKPSAIRRKNRRIQRDRSSNRLSIWIQLQNSIVPQPFETKAETEYRKKYLRDRHKICKSIHSSILDGFPIPFLKRNPLPLEKTNPDFLSFLDKREMDHLDKNQKKRFQLCYLK